MQDFGRTPATALRMSMVTRAAGFAGLSFVPSRFSTPIRPTLLQHALYYPFPRIKLFFTRLFYRFSGNRRELVDCRRFVLSMRCRDPSPGRLLHARDECVAVHGRGHFLQFSNDLSCLFRDSSLAIERSLNS